MHSVRPYFFFFIVYITFFSTRRHAITHNDIAHANCCLSRLNIEPLCIFTDVREREREREMNVSW